MAQLNFDATQVEPDTGFDTVPAGWYNVAMDESELKPTKDGHGTYLQVRFNILDGQYRGRKLFSRLNIRNANAQAQEIALRQLSAIGHAVGVLQIADSNQLHGLPLKVKVKIRPGDDQYEAQNEIISYKNINEQVETVGSTQGAGVAPPAQMPPQQPQGFVQQPPMQQFQQPPQQQFQAPPAQQPVQQPAQQQPWGQPPLANAPQPDHPFQQGQPQQAQPEQNWQQAPVQQQAPAQQAPAQQDPHAAAAQQAQTAPPPWANQGQPQQ